MFDGKWKLGWTSQAEKSDTSLSQTATDESVREKDIIYVDISTIKPNPYQPRKQFNPTALDELSESIKCYGVMQPINVRRLSANSYELVAGERRLRAAAMAGLTKMPVILVNVNDNDSAIMALIENIQRENLGFLEEAEAYSNLLASSRITQEELAAKLGKSQSTIANKLRILKLSEQVKKIILANGLTERHARALLKLGDDQLQCKVLEVVCQKGLNVKRTEELVERVYEKYIGNVREKEEVQRKMTRVVSDIRIFVNTIRQAIEVMRSAGVNAKAAQFDRGEYVEFIVRVPKRQGKAV